LKGTLTTSNMTEARMWVSIPSRGFWFFEVAVWTRQQ